MLSVGRVLRGLCCGADRYGEVIGAGLACLVARDGHPVRAVGRKGCPDHRPVPAALEVVVVFGKFIGAAQQEVGIELPRLEIEQNLLTGMSLHGVRVVELAARQRLIALRQAAALMAHAILCRGGRVGGHGLPRARADGKDVRPGFAGLIAGDDHTVLARGREGHVEMRAVRAALEIVVVFREVVGPANEDIGVEIVRLQVNCHVLTFATLHHVSIVVLPAGEGLVA